MKEVISVKVAQSVVAESPNVLTTSGVGSCIVICLYEKTKKIGALAHIMLPHMFEVEDKNSPNFNPYRFVDTALPLMVTELTKKGVEIKDVEAKLVGGASMFKSLTTDKVSVGPRNIQMAKTMLESVGIKIDNESVGGTVGRNVEFDLDTGIVSVVTRM